jgi:hypothetical protein
MGIGLANIVYWSTGAVAPAFTGLLDTYPGAAVAYSLRLLQSDYSGNAIKVRRASDNAEQDIGFVNNELDTASLETFCSGTDGFVTTWYDQSANGNNAIQASAANQPQIVSSGTSLGYIQWFGSGALDSTANGYFANSDYSTFFVGQNTGDCVWGMAPGNSYYAVAREGFNNTFANGFTEGNRYSNGSLIGASWDDMYTALTSFAQVSVLVEEFNTSPKKIRMIGFSGFNNGRLKEYIIYQNQTISRTGVETNIVDHYNF